MDSIGDILGAWPHDPDGISVRLVQGDDGRTKLQMRIELGILQMELDGRPDAGRPEGCESWLTYHLQRLDQHRHDGGSVEGFQLTPLDCTHLREEATLYYQRYLGLYHLGRFPEVVRDTARNLHVCDLLHRFAEQEEERWELEQYRPYITMMNALARAELVDLTNGLPDAERILTVAIASIRAFAARHLGRFHVGNEISVLRERLDQLRQEAPESETERVQRLLEHAVEREDYEAAAQLRDRLQHLTAEQLPPFWE